MRISNPTSTGILDNELTVLEALSAGEHHQKHPVSFYAASGDDIYAVISANREHGRYLYAKLLYGPENGHSHEVAEAGVFDSQFVASQHACRQALEEEKGYAQA